MIFNNKKAFKEVYNLSITGEDGLLTGDYLFHVWVQEGARRYCWVLSQQQSAAYFEEGRHLVVEKLQLLTLSIVKDLFFVKGQPMFKLVYSRRSTGETSV